MDGFKLLEIIALEMDIPVISTVSQPASVMLVYRTFSSQMVKTQIFLRLIALKMFVWCKKYDRDAARACLQNPTKI
jgi:hypothetical protein